MRAKLPYLVGGVVALLIALRIGIHFATPPPVTPKSASARCSPKASKPSNGRM
jgi:hypothetical protein